VDGRVKPGHDEKGVGAHASAAFASAAKQSILFFVLGQWIASLRSQ
jgi:hypothetical protein